MTVIGYIQDVAMNLGPYGAGAAAVVATAFVPGLDAIPSIVPLPMLSGAAGYAVATNQQDQMCAALKGIAGGVGAAMILSRM